jgi:hypothetical protein
MLVSPGDQLGAYEILVLIHAGRMGEVFRRSYRWQSLTLVGSRATRTKRLNDIS